MFGSGMINTSWELISADIFGRLRRGKVHDWIVNFGIFTVLDSLTKSNTWTCLLPTTIIDPSSKSVGFKSLVLPNFWPSKF